MITTAKLGRLVFFVCHLTHGIGKRKERKTKTNMNEGILKSMSDSNLEENDWMNRKIDIEQRRKHSNPTIYTHYIANMASLHTQKFYRAYLSSNVTIYKRHVNLEMK